MIFPNIEVQPHWLATLHRAAAVMHNVRWLCVAVDLCIEPKTEQEIREAIAQAIAPFNTVNSWIICETGTGFTENKESKEYRKAWLNHMIKQCRSMQPKEPT